MKDTGVRSAIFIGKIISNKALQMYKNVYLCFIADAHSFDNICHKEMNSKESLFVATTLTI